MPRVPINTISFNCSDREANVFLCQLAKETGGRFHYYSEDGIAIDGPEPWEVSESSSYLIAKVSICFYVVSRLT